LKTNHLATLRSITEQMPALVYFKQLRKSTLPTVFAGDELSEVCKGSVSK
jgi:hypothetical protein